MLARGRSSKRSQELVIEGLKVRQGVSVRGGDGIHMAVVATWAPVPILLPDEVERCPMASGKTYDANLHYVVKHSLVLQRE